MGKKRRNRSQDAESARKAREDPVGTPFPFTRLPVELQSLIISYAIDDARASLGRSSRRNKKQRPVGNILCVSSLVHALAIPYLYRTLEWHSFSQSQQLERTFRSRPEYAAHLRHIRLPRCDNDGYLFECALDMVWAIRTNRRGLVLPLDKLKSAVMSFPSFRLEQAVDALRILQPFKVVLETQRAADDEIVSDNEEDEDIEFEIVEPNLAVAAAIDTPSEGWLSRLQTLHLDGFQLDRATAELLSKLPNLTTLTLSGHRWPLDLVAKDAFLIILSEGETRSTLRCLLVGDCLFRDRCQAQQTLGICIPTLSIGLRALQARKTIPDVESDSRMWHGCQKVSFNREFFTLTSCTPCPRCCSLRDGSSLRETQPGERHRYNLCKQHYDEIFGSAVEVSETQRELNFVRRKALECMRWIPHDNDEGDSIEDWT